MKKHIKFNKHPRVEEGSNIGSYYTEYDPKTGEGEGWFGTESEVSYYFEYRLDDEGVMRSRTCGVGSGCFWTEFE